MEYRSIARSEGCRRGLRQRFCGWGCGFRRSRGERRFDSRLNGFIRDDIDAAGQQATVKLDDGVHLRLPADGGLSYDFGGAVK